MHTRSILAIARKDALDILLNKGALISLLTPIFLAILFTVVSSLIGAKTSNLYIYNPGRSGVEQAVSSFFARPQITHAGSAEDVAAAFGSDGTNKSSQYALGLVVPSDFEASVRRGEQPQLSLFLNGSELDYRDRAVLARLVTEYASSVAAPHPLSLSLSMINPPKSTAAVDINYNYIAIALVSSFLVGTSLVPSLLIEEKEKKTLRMLMVSPASFTDVIMGKLLVGLGYQLLLSLIVLTLMQGFTGNIALLMLFVVLGSCFSLVLGLLAGSLFQTTAGLGTFTTTVSLFYVFPPLFAGMLGVFFQGSMVVQIAQLFPTYYIADGIYRVLQNQSLFDGMLLDLLIVLGCALALFVAVVWSLRRQAAVAATI